MKAIITLAFLSVYLWKAPEAKPLETVLKGRLTTKNGDAIPGCNVVLKGQTIQVTTQGCGEFEIAVPGSYEGVLVFSCMSSRVWEIKAEKFKGKEDIVVVLTDWYQFENGPCDKKYQKGTRIKIH